MALVDLVGAWEDCQSTHRISTKKLVSCAG